MFEIERDIRSGESQRVGDYEIIPQTNVFLVKLRASWRVYLEPSSGSDRPDYRWRGTYPTGSRCHPQYPLGHAGRRTTGGNVNRNDKP